MPNPNQGLNIDKLTSRIIPLQGRKITGAADGVNPTDYVTLRQTDRLVLGLLQIVEGVKQTLISLLPKNLFYNLLKLQNIGKTSALELLSYDADNDQILFDCDWNGTDVIALNAVTARIVKNGGYFSIHGAGVDTPGSPVAQNPYVVIELSTGRISFNTNAPPGYGLDVETDINCKTGYFADGTAGLSSHTFPLKALTALGSDGSIVVKDGLVVNGSDPT